MKGNWTEKGGRAERCRKKTQGQRDPEAKRGNRTRTVGYKQGAGCKIADREVQGSRKNDTEKKAGGPGAGQRAGERKNTAVEQHRGMNKERGMESRAEKRQKKISSGEPGRGQ